MRQTSRHRVLWLGLWPLLAWPCAAQAPEPAPAAPTRVTVGAYVNDILAIDLAHHAFSVDLYVWFRWKDPAVDPVASFEFMNLYDPDGHVQTVSYDKPKPQPDGSLYQIIRHQGQFSTKFPLRAYPFDRQTLVVAFEDNLRSTLELQYEADGSGAALNPEIILPGYQMQPIELTIRDKPYPTTFGDLAQPNASAYSHGELHIPIVRPWASSLFKVIVPVLLIILTAAFSLLLDPIHVEARIGLAITALLTLVALQFTMLSGLPEVAYLTLLDQVFLASYAYIMVVVALLVRATRTDQVGELRGDVHGIEPLTHRGGLLAFAVTGTYLLVLAAIIWINVSAATGPLRLE